MSSRATATIRDLKNKETGIDLAVTSFTESKGMLGSTYEYQIMVVSNLSYFKTPKHKEAANVQFTVMKKMADFEELHSKLNTKYSGMALPVLPKKVLMMNDTVAKERRNNFDSFLKFLASTPKLCVDSVLLLFLGVSSLKAGSEKIKKLVVSDKPTDVDNTATEDITEGIVEKTEEKEEEDLFATEDGGQSDDEEEDMFTAQTISSSRKVDTKLFDDQDLSGALEEGEGDDLFIEGSRSNITTTAYVKDTDEAESNDLFSSDDELDKIMEMKLTNNTKAESDNETEAPLTSASPAMEERPVQTSSHDASEENRVKSDSTLAEGVLDSPALPEKPKITKPKPALRAKPVVPNRGDHLNVKNASEETRTQVTSDNNKQGSGDMKIKPKPPLKQKPTLTKKPEIKHTVADTSIEKQSGEGKLETKETNVVADLSENDIMKYIQDNAASADDDLDLFS